MRATNDAILAKLGQRLLQQLETLWSWVIRGKYCRGRTDIDIFTRLSRALRNWKGLVEGSWILAKGVKRTIGNGNATLFWFHNWLEDRLLIDLAINPVPEIWEGVAVAEYWSDNGWNQNALHNLLPPIVVSKLASIRVDARSSITDKIFWGLTESGLFTTKSALCLQWGDWFASRTP